MARPSFAVCLYVYLCVRALQYIVHAYTRIRLNVYTYIDTERWEDLMPFAEAEVEAEKPRPRPRERTHPGSAVACSVPF